MCTGQTPPVPAPPVCTPLWQSWGAEMFAVKSDARLGDDRQTKPSGATYVAALEQKLLLCASVSALAAQDAVAGWAGHGGQAWRTHGGPGVPQPQASACAATWACCSPGRADMAVRGHKRTVRSFPHLVCDPEDAGLGPAMPPLWGRRVNATTGP